jgi:DNA-binding response OmpR family regulator
MAKILIVDDDIELATTLAGYLGAKGYTTEKCGSGEDALTLLGNFHYDLMILDWSLPGIDGEEVCRKFRRQGGQTPIIFLTGSGDIVHLQTGLDSGADGFMSKPFEIRELAARIKTLLKRRTEPLSPELHVQDLTLNTETRCITVGANVVPLRGKELKLLEYLISNTDRVFSAQQLVEANWPADAGVTTGSVRAWINFLRQKLAEAGRPDLIETVGRAGYRIRS